MLYRKRAGEKPLAHWAAADGALSIQPFEGSRVTTLWDLNRVSPAGWWVVHENGVWEGRGSEAEDVISVWMDLDRKRWRGSERVLRARIGTRRVLALKALSHSGIAASVS